MAEQFDSSRPIYAQLVERLKAKILAGIYPPGGHLDSVRDLATAAGVNPNTMQRAGRSPESAIFRSIFISPNFDNFRPEASPGYAPVHAGAAQRLRPDGGCADD